MIYILGGNGFVGSGFVRLFQRLELEHMVVTRGNYSELTGTTCDVFINANGNSSKLLADREPLRDFDANVRVTRETLEDFKTGCYIHLSTCDVYPDCSLPEITREDQVISPARQNAYGFHKFLGEECVRHKAGRWLIFRQGGFIGPGMKKNAVFDILYGDTLWLAPQSRLQFLHTDVSAECIWTVYAAGVMNEVMNICGCGTVCLSDVMAWAGRKIPIQENSPRVTYEVSVKKIQEFVSLPNTAGSVKEFVKNAVAAHGRTIRG